MRVNHAKREDSPCTCVRSNQFRLMPCLAIEARRPTPARTGGRNGLPLRMARRQISSLRHGGHADKSSAEYLLGRPDADRAKDAFGHLDDLVPVILFEIPDSLERVAFIFRIDKHLHQKWSILLIGGE